MAYTDGDGRLLDIVRYLHDIRTELKRFRETVIGIGTLLILLSLANLIWGK